MKIAITGATGLVGSRIIELLSDQFDYIPLGSADMDIADRTSVENKLSSIDFDIIVHLAGYTNVDAAENEREQARILNVDGTANVFEAATTLKKPMIYVSTGFVFDGTNPPYDENSLPNPIGYYGQTKFEGEEIVKGKAMIVRIDYPYRSWFDRKKDFVKTLLDHLAAGRRLSMITDSVFTPTFIDDIAYGMGHLLNHFSPEIYHLVGASSLTPYEAALEIAKEFGYDTKLVGQTTYDRFFAGKAARPKDGTMVSRKNDFHPMKTFTEGLREMKRQLASSRD